MTFQHPSIYVVNYQKIRFLNAHHFICMGTIHDMTLFYDSLDFIFEDYVKKFRKLRGQNTNLYKQIDDLHHSAMYTFSNVVKNDRKYWT